MYIAHKKDDGKVQTIMEHITNTARLAGQFAKPFGSEQCAYLCGMLHDIGKYSAKFQRRILEGGNSVDHSTAGAVEIDKRMQTIGFLLAYCIAGHHTGLPDGGSLADTGDAPTLHGRLKKRIESYEQFETEVNMAAFSTEPALEIRPLERAGFSVSFYIRMLFSCLVDGDYLDTEGFMSDGINRNIGEDFDTLNCKLDEYIKPFENPTNAINKKRTEILDSCIQKSVWDKGLYTLTVPTGGGKTIASLAFAIKHAILHKMNRIIYVIPYNSIIEQNAAVLRKY